MLTSELVDSIARDLFPASGPFASYEYVSAEIGKGWARRPNDPDFLMMTVRLVIWGEMPNGDRTIRDVKEQSIALADAGEDVERFTAYLQAWHAALEKALTHAHELETLMPHDLVCSDVLKLKTARTREDFERALLQKSRLGARLPEHLRTPASPSSATAVDDLAKAEQAARRASAKSSSKSAPSSTDGSL